MKAVLQTVAGLILAISVALPQQREGRATGPSERFDKDDVKTISGKVTAVKHPLATFKGDDGKEYQVHLGPVWYWENEKYEFKADAKAQIKGEVKEMKGVNHLYPWEIVQNGKTLTLADKDGVPQWAGGKKNACCKNGKERGHGHGKGHCGGKHSGRPS